MGKNVPPLLVIRDRLIVSGGCSSLQPFTAFRIWLASTPLVVIEFEEGWRSVRETDAKNHYSANCYPQDALLLTNCLAQLGVPFSVCLRIPVSR